MIEKINESAYFVVDTFSYSRQISAYDPNVASQTISAVDLPPEPDLELEVEESAD